MDGVRNIVDSLFLTHSFAAAMFRKRTRKELKQCCFVCNVKKDFFALKSLRTPQVSRSWNAL